MNRIIHNATLALSALACTSLLLAIPAHAQDRDNAPTKIVRYADLNLNTQQGIDTLYQRLQSASRSVCSQFKSRDLSMRKHWQDCYRQALSGAVNKINVEKLTALHQQHDHQWS